jgi:hypothetical protein
MCSLDSPIEATSALPLGAAVEGPDRGREGGNRSYHSLTGIGDILHVSVWRQIETGDNGEPPKGGFPPNVSISRRRQGDMSPNVSMSPVA